MSRLLWIAAASFGLGGCAGYHGMINTMAPERQPSEARLTTYAPKDKGDAKSPFCAAPPIAAPKVTEVYMVMPEEGGKVGTVDVVFSDGKNATLHGPYSAMTLAGSEQKTFVGNEAQMRTMFGEAVGALPPAPMTVTLYFLLGKDELAPESRAEAENIYRSFLARQAPEIRIVGHTDTVGSKKHNLKLSLKRAEKVRTNLIKLGIPAESIQVAGKGEEELLVITPDNTQQPKNRRVDINVR